MLTSGDATRLRCRAVGKPVCTFPVPMRLVRVGLYAADPIASIRLGIDQPGRWRCPT